MMIEAEILAKYPKFKTFLEDLKVRLDCSKELTYEHQKNIELRDELQSQIAAYFKRKLLYDTLKDLTLVDKPSLTLEKAVSVLKERLAMAEDSAYLSHPVLSSLVDNSAPSLTECEEEKWRASISSLVESRLNEREKLPLKLYYKNGEENKDITLLVKDVKTDLATLEQNKTRLEELLNLKSKMTTEYAKVLKDSISTLKEHIEILISKAKTNHALTEQFVIKCKTLFLKFRDLELTLLTETYSPKVIAAHKIIKNKLHSQKESLENELNSALTTLHTFQSLGPRFEQLVEEYHQLQKEVENKKWAVGQFSTASNHSSNTV